MNRNTRTLPHPKTLGFLAFFGTLSHAAIAQAAFTICAVGQVTTIDSGRTIPNGPNAGDTEDFWANADSTINVPAAGIYISYEWLNGSQGGGGGGFANSSGCMTLSETASTVTEVRIYSMSNAGNTVRVHNNPGSFATTPGSLYSYVYVNQNYQDNQTYTYTVGSGIAKWTTFFVASFMSEAFDTNVLGKSIHVGIDEAACPQSNTSAHYGGSVPNRSNGQITSGRHFLSTGNCATSPHSRQKFLISHEMGHALAALFYGAASGAVDGDEPNSTDYTNDSDPSRAPNATACQSSSPYTINTKEWNSVTFREGYAHWAAASSWSTPIAEGAFTWFQSSEDLERYGQGSGMFTGGQLENVCCTSGCTTSWDSAATNGDWLRFLWDFDTATNCASNPNQYTLLKIYRQTRLNGSLTLGNYYTRSRAAMAGLYSGSTYDCLRASWDTWAAWNGIDHDT